MLRKEGRSAFETSQSYTVSFQASLNYYSMKYCFKKNNNEVDKLMASKLNELKI